MDQPRLTAGDPTTAIARLVSIGLGPPLLPVLILAAVYRSGLAGGQIAVLLPALIALELVIPAAFIALRLRQGRVSAWDLPRREERHAFLALFGACSLVALGLIHVYGTPQLARLHLMLLVLLGLIVAITSVFKISLHVSLATVTALLLNYLSGWQWPVLYLMIPAVMWARLRLKRHTPWELVAAFVLSSGLVLGALLLLPPI